MQRARAAFKRIVQHQSPSKIRIGALGKASRQRARPTQLHMTLQLIFLILPILCVVVAAVIHSGSMRWESQTMPLRGRLDAGRVPIENKVST